MIHYVIDITSFSLEMAESWVSVEVRRGAKVLQPATILTATQEANFDSLLGRNSGGFQVETVEKTLLSS